MKKHVKPKKISRPVRTGAPEIPPEMQGVLRDMTRLARESPDGWGTIAQVFLENPEFEPEIVLPFLAQSLGKEVLPLLRGAALEEEEELAIGALKALPLLKSRAAGDVLVEAFAAYPDGDRARLAWEGVQALQAQGINVSVPEPDGVRRVVPAFELREMWETAADGVGSRSAHARGQDRYGVWQTVMVVWNDRAGVKDGFVAAISRREWEEVLKEERGQGIVVLQVPPDYTRWQIARARALNARSGFPLEDHLEAWDQFVGPAPEEYQPPDPLEAVRKLSAEERAELAEATEELWDIPALQNWSLEPADCRPWLEEWTAVMDDESLSDEEFELRMDALLRRAVRELVTSDTAALYRERLLDTSRKLTWLKQEAEAGLVAAVALAIEEAPGPEHARFFRDLADNGLSMLQEMVEDGEDPDRWRYDPLRPVDDVESEEEEDEA
jgi:hypothetical protein